MSIELTEAKTDDIEAIDRCNRALLPENYPREFYESFFASDYCFNFVVRDKSDVAPAAETVPIDGSNDDVTTVDKESEKEKAAPAPRQTEHESSSTQEDKHKSNADKQSDIAGYILCLLQNDQKMAVVGHIYSIGVYEQFRRRGFATALMMCAEAVMKKRCPELKYLSLHVRKKNKEAYKFYTKLGFSRAKVVKKYYSNPAEDAYLMKKPVAATTTAPQAE